MDVFYGRGEVQSLVEGRLTEVGDGDDFDFDFAVGRTAM